MSNKSIVLTYLKSTKGTEVYVNDDDNPVINRIYINNDHTPKDPPKTVTVTIAYDD